MKTAGFILTGGNSSRMGTDKAMLPLRNSPMVEAIGNILRRVTGEVLLVGKPERYTGLPFECLPDLRPGLGPLSGLETALTSRRADLNVVVACDLAGLREAWINSLMEVMAPPVLCAAAIDEKGKLQPLCAIYRSECLGYVERALDDGRLRALDLLSDLNTIAVPIDDVIPNINTPEEFNNYGQQR